MTKRVFVVGIDNMVGSMFESFGLRVVGSSDMADLICFTGGGDINPALYGQKAISDTRGINDSRDTSEKTFYGRLTKEIPKIGICRGGQLLNVLNGGSMFQDVTEHRTGLHRTWIHEKYAETKNKSYYLNTYHHQMMVPNFDDPSMEIIGIAANSTERKTDSGHYIGRADFETNPDYEIIWYGDTHCLCYQPHPEYKSSHSDTTDVFKHLCKQLNIF